MRLMGKRKMLRKSLLKRSPGWGPVLVSILFVSALLGMSPDLHAAVKTVNDADISVAIETEYYSDNSVNAENIDVTTESGIVSLDGTVENILAKERAAEIASTIVGVRAVVNRLEVLPYVSRTDSELKAGIINALAINPATESFEVTVSVSEGVVTLSGTVESWQERRLCAIVTKSVRGVKAVENEITIEYKETRADKEIETEVEALLKNDVRVDDYLIDVSVTDAVVTLSGVVGSVTEKNSAYVDAWVTGVKDVNAEDLEVEYWARNKMRRTSVYTSRSDEEIRDAILDAFLRDPRVMSFDITVRVSDGTVTLSGIVNYLGAKRAAEEDARNVIGVWRVKNNIKVRPLVIPESDDLVARVEAALGEDPYVNKYDVKVSAVAGWVTLSGEVNTDFEKVQAEMVTENVPGVTRVFNNINYEYNWTWKPDWEIKADIEDQLWWSPFVDSDAVAVRVERGVAILTGTVDTWAERYDAEQNAYEGGAKDVRNQLEVSDEIHGPYPERGTINGWGYYFGY